MIEYLVYVWGVILILLLKVTTIIVVVVAVVGLPALLGSCLVRAARRPRIKQFIPALSVALVLGGSAISQAQIICTIPCPTWDFTAILRTIALQEIKEHIDEVAQFQAEKLYKMAWRLQQFIPLVSYVIDPDNRPEWRIFDWFSEAVLVAKPFQHALSSGDRNGDGFTEITLPRPDAADVLGQLSSKGAEEIRKRMAIIDLQDSTIIRATDEAGLLRYNGRETQGAVDRFQHDILKDDNEESSTAVLDKISAARLLHLRDQEARMKLRNAELELALIENIVERDGAATTINSFIARKKDNSRTANALVQGADVLSTWSQP
jgi:hypothetical protein